MANRVALNLLMFIIGTYGCPEYFVNVHNWAPSCYVYRMVARRFAQILRFAQDDMFTCYAYRMVARRFALLCAGHEYLSVRFYQLRHVPRRRIPCRFAYGLTGRVRHW